MKTIIKTTLALLTLTFTSLYASGSHAHNSDGGHGHEHKKEVVSKSVVEAHAKTELESLVKKQKIDAQWSGTPTREMKKKKFHHNVEWVVSFKNTKVENKTKQTLYIFIDLEGKTTGVNFTGE